MLKPKSEMVPKRSEAIQIKTSNPKNNKMIYEKNYRKHKIKETLKETE
jgi:hypothetical protein